MHHADMKILLFGGSGRIGTTMQRLWKNHHMIAPSRAEVDVSDGMAIEKALEQYRPELVINLVAYNNVDKAEQDDRDLAFTLNFGLPTRLATITASHNLPFFHFSTDYVFEGNKPEGYTEMDTPSPISIYGESKHLGEAGALRENPRTYIIRTSRVYGPNAMSANAKRTFIELILDDATQMQTVPVNPIEVSAPTYGDDLVRQIEQHLFSFPEPGIYHLANQEGGTWMEWAQEIVKHLDIPVTIVPRDLSTLIRAAKRPQHSILINTKLPPMRPWQEALQEFLATKPWPFNPVWQPSK